jgi:hypothetical protein
VDGEGQASAPGLEAGTDPVCEPPGVVGRGADQKATAAGAVEDPGEAVDVVDDGADTLIEEIEGGRGAGGHLDALGGEDPALNAVGVEGDEAEQGAFGGRINRGREWRTGGDGSRRFVADGAKGRL